MSDRAMMECKLFPRDIDFNKAWVACAVTREEATQYFTDNDCDETSVSAYSDALGNVLAYRAPLNRWIKIRPHVFDSLEDAQKFAAEHVCAHYPKDQCIIPIKHAIPGSSWIVDECVEESRP